MADSNLPQGSAASPARRGLLGWAVLAAILLLPAGIYGFYVLGQLDDIRRHDLRDLQSAAQAAEDLLENSETTVRNLLRGDSKNWACPFFERQTRLKLDTPGDCTGLPTFVHQVDFRLEVEADKLFLIATCYDLAGAAAGTCARMEVALGALLDQIPFGESFDQLLVADQDGRVLEQAVSPQRGSPLLPPAVLVPQPQKPVRALSIVPATPKEQAPPPTDAPADAPVAPADATLVRDVDIAGTRFTLMCQPWRVALDGKLETWNVCGLKDAQRSFGEALEVAPNVVVMLLVFLVLAVISGPIFKVLSLAPQERLRFSDMYLVLIATLGLVMVLSVGVADLATYTTLRAQSAQRLKTLAEDIEGSLRAEIDRMHAELSAYDTSVAKWAALTTGRVAGARVSCLLLSPEARAGDSDCKDKDLILPAPSDYPDLESVFWIRPCDGQQIVKGTTLFANTPLISVRQRQYYSSIKSGTAWHLQGSDGPFFVETGVSFTTGDFFAALSILSALPSDGTAAASMPANRPSDCTATEAKRFVAAVSGPLVSTRYSVLAPGVGFAIVEGTGRVVAHSDERRATFENLLDDEGLAERLRAALLARSDADFYAYYLTRPHQVNVHPLSGLPWTIVTFADDEVLRTTHVELLVRSFALVAVYLLAAVLGTLLYILIRGRQPPVWMWPRREPAYHRIYRMVGWSLTAQLAIFLVAVDLLSGLALLAVSFAFPLLALTMVGLATGAAERPDPKRLHLSCGLAIVAAVLVLVAAVVAVAMLDPVSAATMRFGLGSVVASALALLWTLATVMSKQVWRSVFPWVMRDPLLPHMAGTLAVWIIIGAVPAYGLYKLALEREMTVTTMAEQAYVARAEAWRACRVNDALRRVARPAAATFPMRRSELGGTLPRYTDVYPRARLAQASEADTLREAASYDDSRRAAARLWDAFAGVAPVYNETTAFLRYLDPLGARSVGRWSWSLGDGPPLLVYEHAPEGSCAAPVEPIASSLPLAKPAAGPLLFLAGAVFFGLLIAWVSYSARRLFFGVIENDVCKPGPSLDPHVEHLARPPDKDWLDAEVHPLTDPYQISAETRAQWLREHSTRRAVVDRILDQARPCYTALWEKTDDDEKLALLQIVQEGFANPKQTEVVRRLLRGGLLRRDPVLRPMNHSFALFVEGAVKVGEVQQRERAHHGLRWSRVRTLLIGVFVIVLLFLTFTQRDAVQAWLAYLTTAGGVAIGVFKLASLVSRPGVPKD